jgi:FtsP/CotA-like multicopper oxidase with cupredoxin domain
VPRSTAVSAFLDHMIPIDNAPSTQAKPYLLASDNTPWTRRTAISPCSRCKFDRPGEYVWHCHILSHEDHEMMRPYRVI